MAIKIDTGVPMQRKQYAECADDYIRGYRFAQWAKTTATRGERDRWLAQPVHDSFSEGLQDGLLGRPYKYANRAP